MHSKGAACGLNLHFDQKKYSLEPLSPQSSGLGGLQLPILLLSGSEGGLMECVISRVVSVQILPQ